MKHKKVSGGLEDVDTLTQYLDLEIEVSQRWALRQHSCKTLYPGYSNVIAAEIEVHQLPALSQHSCKLLCTGCSEV